VFKSADQSQQTSIVLQLLSIWGI